MLNPLFKNDMVLWKGISPATQRHIVLQVKRNREEHAICPVDFIETAKILGLDVRPHWMPDTAAKGIMCIWSHVNVRIFEKKPTSAYNQYKVEPFILDIAKSKGIKNQTMLHVLRRD